MRLSVALLFRGEETTLWNLVLQTSFPPKRDVSTIMRGRNDNKGNNGSLTCLFQQERRLSCTPSAQLLVRTIFHARVSKDARFLSLDKSVLSIKTLVVTFNGILLAYR